MNPLIENIDKLHTPEMGTERIKRNCRTETAETYLESEDGYSMQDKYIRLVPADISLAEQVTNYYKRNRKFLADYEPKRDEQFFSLEYQREVLKKEMDDFQCSATRFLRKADKIFEKNMTDS